MTPAARLAAAMEVLGAIEARYRPVAQALSDWGVAHRFAGSKDRAAIGNLAYDALRWRASTAWAMGDDTPRALVLGVVGLRWGFGVERLAAMLAGDPHAPPPLTESEAARMTAFDFAAAPDAVRADVPEWIAPSLERVFGAAWPEEGAALALRPPLDLRVNTLKADRDKVLRALAKSSAEPTTLSPVGLRVAPTSGEGRHPNVQVEPAFQKGFFEVQDEGSQLAALLVGAQPGMQVLDLCAGAGGKTLALAAAMANKGQLHATDADRSRLAPIFNRLKRAGTRNVQVHEAGADLSALHGRMDRVLIDAPCTGTGTWRRRPDAKWRLTAQAIADRAAEQDALLASAAAFVKPGGALVYVTCSVLPEENSDRVAAFAAAHPDFAVVTAAEIVASAGVEPALAERLAGAMLAVVGGLQMTPRRTGTDGFFVAVLRR